MAGHRQEEHAPAELARDSYRREGEGPFDSRGCGQQDQRVASGESRDELGRCEFSGDLGTGGPALDRAFGELTMERLGQLGILRRPANHNVAHRHAHRLKRRKRQRARRHRNVHSVPQTGVFEGTRSLVEEVVDAFHPELSVSRDKTARAAGSDEAPRH